MPYQQRPEGPPRPTYEEDVKSVPGLSCPHHPQNGKTKCQRAPFNQMKVGKEASFRWRSLPIIVPISLW
jgi:hypothetical protein